MSWTLGVFYDDVEDRYLARALGLYLVGSPISISTSTTIIDGTSTSTSVFGNMSYILTDKVTVDLGGRYYEDDKSQLFYWMVLRSPIKQQALIIRALEERFLMPWPIVPISISVSLRVLEVAA